MLLHRRVSRRDVLRAALVAGAAVAVPGRAMAEVCQETPPQEEGPFYLNSYVTGRVTDEECGPVKGAMVEIWQANAKGRYVHAADPNPAPKDPNFLGFGEAMTDENGIYSFKTIKPGAYPVPGGWIRPPHIHFKVHGGFFHMMVTQMYFAGEEHNRDDFLLNSVSKAEQKRLIIEPARRPESNAENLYTFNVALKPFQART